MGKRRLMKDVSVAELQEYRAEGYTNKEIAEMLGVSPNTIYAHIGKMPPELRSKAVKDAKNNVVEPEHAAPAEEPAVPLMLTINEIITVAGTTRRYTIDRSTETVFLESTEGDGDLLLKYDEIDTLILELRMIRRRMGDSIEVGVETW